MPDNDGGTTGGTTGANGEPVVTVVDEYFENEEDYEVPDESPVPIKVMVVHSRSPILPKP